MPLIKVMNKINIGVIGLNNHAAKIIKIIDNSEKAECKYIYYPKNIKHSERRVTKKFSNLINYCNGIIIASPTSTHYKYLKLLSNYNGHILVEKPIVSNLEETNKLKDYSLERKKKISINYNFMYSPIAKSIRNIIDNNKIGKPILLNIHASHGLAFSKSYKLNWRSKKKSFGVVGLVGVHYINSAINLFGKIKKSNITYINIAKTGNAPDTAFIQLTMPNKIEVHIWLSYAAPFTYNISLHGDNGRYEYNGKLEALYSPRDFFDVNGRYTNPPLIFKNNIDQQYNWKLGLEKSIEEFISSIIGNNTFKISNYNIALDSMLPLFNKI